jgi:hypothetical protein
MKHPRVKGNRVRRKCINLLESQGWAVEVVEKTSRFVKVKDLYGCWDLICLKTGRTKFVQVKSNTKPKLDPFQEFALKYPQIECEVWIHHDYGGDNPWQIIIMKNQK